MAKTTPYLQNYTNISDILAGNYEIRLTRKLEIGGILRPFAVPINRVSWGPPVHHIFEPVITVFFINH